MEFNNNVKSFWENIYKNTTKGGRLSDSKKLKEFRLKYEIKNIEKFIKLFSSKTTNTFLDLGCGEGLFSQYFSSKGYNITGVDISETQIQKNKNNFKNIFFLSGDISNTEIYNNKKFDIIFIGGVLMYLNNNDVKNVLDFLKNNNLNKGGIIILRESILLNGEINELNNSKYPVYYRNINFYNNFNVIYKKNNLSYTTGYAYSKLNLFLYYMLLPIILLRQKILTHILKKQNQVQYFYIIQ